MTNHIINPSFEDGWSDVSPSAQEPAGWELSWVLEGQPLYDTSDVAGGVPECVHKMAHQLPPNEQRGASDALILDGDATYKIFHYAAPFGAQLVQEVSGLPVGARFRLTVPHLAVMYGLLDPWGVEVGAWVNTTGREGGASRDWQGAWMNAEQMGERAWNERAIDFTVPDGGRVWVIIRFKSKWGRCDFFIDNVRLEQTASPEPPPRPPIAPPPISPFPSPIEPPAQRGAVVVIAPRGMQVITKEGVADKVRVSIPSGVRWEVNGE